MGRKRWDAQVKFSGNLWAEPNVTAEVTEAMQELRPFILDLVESRTPVDTGLMKSSWTVGIGQRIIKIENPTYYSGFIEHGTRRIKPFRCAAGALPAIESRFRDILSAKIEAKYGSGSGRKSSNRTASLLAGAKRGFIYKRSPLPVKR
jgi:hypothetical protein